jgi:ABC-2 type transport system permease protein
MKSLLILTRHSLGRIRVLLLVMGTLLGVFQVFLIIVAGSIQRSDAFEQIGALLPPFVREMLGPSVTSFMSFPGIVCVGYFHLSVMGALIALSIVLATAPASEIEAGFMDLILSRPLARHWIITRTVLIVIMCTLVLLAMMLAGTWIGLNALAPTDARWPSPKLVLSLAANLALLMLCWSGIAMAIGSGARRRSVAGGLAGVIALAAFLLDYIARAWQPAESVAWLSPFRYFNPFQLLDGKPLAAKNVLVLGGIALCGFAASYVIFSRRDISH